MKRITMNMTLAVAALVLAAGTVSAQTMKAEIPFAFRVGKQVMQPGAYRVTMWAGNTGSVIWRLTNYDARQSALIRPNYGSTPSKEWVAAGNAKLSFACAEGPCTLMRLWSGEGLAYNFHSPHGKDGELHVSEITLRPDRAN